MSLLLCQLSYRPAFPAALSYAVCFRESIRQTDQRCYRMIVRPAMGTVLVVGTRMVLAAVQAVMGVGAMRLVRIGHKQCSVAMVIVAVVVTLTVVSIMTAVRGGRDYQRPMRIQFRYDQDVMVVVRSWCDQDVIVVQTAAVRGDYPVSRMATPMPGGRRSEAIVARDRAGVPSWGNTMTLAVIPAAMMSRNNGTATAVPLCPCSAAVVSRSNGMTPVVPPLRECSAARRMPSPPGFVLGFSCRRSQTDHCRQH